MTAQIREFPPAGVRVTELPPRAPRTGTGSGPTATPFFLLRLAWRSASSTLFSRSRSLRWPHHLCTMRSQGSRVAAPR